MVTKKYASVNLFFTPKKAHHNTFSLKTKTRIKTDFKKCRVFALTSSNWNGLQEWAFYQ